ncbi:MAG: hypothetical protein ABFD92_00070 [Planctomycetaceae bacterium]|nr:hypothetical protein [Planctomycetaceae bacterium]
MIYRPGDSIVRGFTTSRFSDGESADADTTPTASMVRNGAVDAAVNLGVAKTATGTYIVSGVLPATYDAGDDVKILVTAVIAGVTGREYIYQGIMDAKRVGDLNDIAAEDIEAAIEPLATAEQLGEAVAPLATAENLAAAVAPLARTDELPPVPTVEEIDAQLTAMHGAGAWTTDDAPLGDETAVDHDFGGVDALRYMHAGQGVGGGTVRAYLTGDYAAGTYTVRGSATTAADGRWLEPMYLPAGSYTLTFSKPRVHGTSTTTIEVSA